MNRTDGYAEYMAEFGYDRDSLPSWELDALSPEVIDGLLQDALDGLLDQDQWDQSMAEEEEAKKALQLASDNWDDTAQWLTDQYGDEE